MAGNKEDNIEISDNLCDEMGLLAEFLEIHSNEREAKRRRNRVQDTKSVIKSNKRVTIT